MGVSGATLWPRNAIRTAVAVATLFHIEIGCADPSGPTLPGRWYTQSQVDQGRAVYRNNCAACHGEQAQGAPDWEVQGELGFYPPPPLNGSGHSAHHPLEDMVRTISMGGTELGGVMPAFVDVLRDPDIRAAVAYLQSLWSDEVYGTWEGIDSGATPAPQPSASEPE